jgi:hypothetical protein
MFELEAENADLKRKLQELKSSQKVCGKFLDFQAHIFAS